MPTKKKIAKPFRPALVLALAFVAAHAWAQPPLAAPTINAAPKTNDAPKSNDAQTINAVPSVNPSPSVPASSAPAAAAVETPSPVPAPIPTVVQLIERDPSELKPGEFIWAPELAPEGPMVMVVSIPEQRAYVYRNGLRIGVSTVSTGKKGHETPTGVFTILQKNKDHRSSLYDDAPMPYMQRLTWDGVALHAGKLPGYPASHGCVRLPYEFSKLLFGATTFGMTVVVADEKSHAPEIAHPGVFAPIDPGSDGQSVLVPRLSWFQAYKWTPEKAPEGPVSILVSAADQRVLVLRNGIEIGRAKFGLVGKAPLGTYAYVLMEGTRAESSKVVPGRPALNWLALSVPGGSTTSTTAQALDPKLAGRIVVPPGFAEAVYAALKPGASVMVTDAPVLSRTSTGQALTVLAAEEAARDPFEDDAVESGE